MPDIITQLRNSDDFIVNPDYENTIAHWDYYTCTLTTSAQYPNELVKGTSRGPIVAPKVKDSTDAVFRYGSEIPLPETVTTPGKNVSQTSTPSYQAYSASDTVIQLSPGGAATLVPNLQLYVESSREQLIITEVDKETDKITVKRAPTSNLKPGQVAASTIAVDDVLHIGATAMKEKSSSSGMRAPVTTQGYENYIQLFDESFELTDSANTFTFRGGPVKMRLSRRAGNNLARAFEFAAWYGQPSEETDAKGVTRYTMSGLLTMIDAYASGNSLAPSDPTTALSFTDICRFEDGFKVGNKGKVMYLCSTEGLAYWDKFARDKYEIHSGESAYGVRINTVYCTHSEVTLVYCPMLDLNIGRKILMVRFNPTEDMLVRRGLPWTVKKIGENADQNWTQDWVYGGYSAEFNLIPEKAGIVYNFASPY